MVLPLLALPAELQALFVVLLADAATAGRLAQASQSCKELLQQRLATLREEFRLQQQARMAAYSNQRRAALLQFFRPGEGGATFVCNAHAMAGGTPCGMRLRARGSLSVLFNHLRNYHSAEYTSLMLMLGEM